MDLADGHVAALRKLFKADIGDCTILYTQRHALRKLMSMIFSSVKKWSFAV